VPLSIFQLLHGLDGLLLADPYPLYFQLHLLSFELDDLDLILLLPQLLGETGDLLDLCSLSGGQGGLSLVLLLLFFSLKRC
jgi:hypothetical protein